VRGYRCGHFVREWMPVRLVCAIVAGVAVRPYCGRALSGVAGALCGRCANWRGLWPRMARVFAGCGAGCIGARVVAGAGFGPFRHGDNLRN